MGGRRVVYISGSVFVSPSPAECYFETETKIEPDLRLLLDYSLYEWIIESTNEIILPLMNSLVC